tara:strand:- start:2823 stop:3497 length:675 start_codon:yes stop_codon:yes gene_type:complete
MATNTVNGILVCSDGTNIPLKAELAEGTESDLTTDTTYTVSAQNIGDYGMGKTITRGLVTCDNGVAYAYILRQGLVAAIVPVAIKGISSPTPALCAPFTLQAGDKLRCMNNTSADREGALCYYTAQGVSRIAVVTPTGGATNELVDLQTSNSIGDTVQGQRIVKAFFTSVDGAKIETPGAVVVDALGNVVGSVSATDPSKFQAGFNDCSIPVNLNFKAQYLTNA